MRTGASFTSLLALAIAIVACGDSASDAAGGGGAAAGGAPQGGNGNGGQPTTGGTGGTGGLGGDGGMGGAAGGDGGAGAGWPVEPPNYCNLCALGDSFALQNVEIDEASGIVASLDYDDIFYINNDSGDSNRFFAVNGDGTSQGSFTLQSVTHVDYEDIARGPCAVGSCVYVADTGDNDVNRPFYALYRVPEPSTLGQDGEVVLPTQLLFKYPDASHNSETLLIHPITGEIVIITKELAGNAGIFRAPAEWPPSTIIDLEKVGEITPAAGAIQFTGGDVHPLGHGILLRTYSNVYYFAAAGPEAPLEDTLSTIPCVMPAPEEVKGEAIGWTKAGDGYVTVSEGACIGEPPMCVPLNFVDCAL